MNRRSFSISYLKNFFKERSWKNSIQLSESEKRVLQFFLKNGDPRLKKFWLQWKHAKEFKREFATPNKDQYELRWRRSKWCLSHNCFKPRIESKQLIFTDPLTGKELTFKLMIQHYGWCGPLIGQTLDGSPFPLEWEFNGLNSHDQNSDFLDLPMLADQDKGIKRLENWLKPFQINQHFKHFIEVFDPATDTMLNELRKNLSIEIPDVYYQFLTTTNGLLIGESYFPGAPHCALSQFPDDSYPISILLAEDVINNLSDGYYCLQLVGDDENCVIHYDMYGKREKVCSSLQEFLVLQFSELQDRYGKYLDSFSSLKST